MDRFIYTEHHLKFLELGYRVMGISDLTHVFNKKFGFGKTDQEIRACIKNHKFKSGRTTGELNKGKNKLLTKDQDQYLREAYKERSLIEIAEEMNEIYGLSLTSGQLKTYCGNHKILSGRTGYFKKGEKPWNTGTKGLVKPNSGNFKKGNVPANIKPIGTERIDSKDGYVLIKVAEEDPYTGFPTRYKLKHHHIWEQEHGQIPEGTVLTFIDGDKLNCSIENLELITMAENAVMNKFGIRYVPEELRPAAKNLVNLSIRKRELMKESRKRV